LRQEELKLLPIFANYADYSLRSKNAKPLLKQVNGFLHDFSETFKITSLSKIWLELRAYAPKHLLKVELQAWDICLLRRKIEKSKPTKISDETNFVPTFQNRLCLRFLFEVCHVLYGLTITEQQKYRYGGNPDVSYFSITDSQGVNCGVVFNPGFNMPVAKKRGWGVEWMLS